MEHKMKFKKTLCGLVAGLAMYGGLSGNLRAEQEHSETNSLEINLSANANQTESVILSKPMPEENGAATFEIENSQGYLKEGSLCLVKKEDRDLTLKLKCVPKEKYNFRKPFTWQESQFSFTWINDNTDVNKIYNAEGRAKVAFVGGYDFIYSLIFELQVPMAKLKVIGGWQAEMTGLAFLPELSFGYAFGKEKNMYFRVRDVHASYRRTEDKEHKLERFLIEHPGVKVSDETIKEMNVVMAEFGHRFNYEGNKIEWSAAYGRYQTSPEYMISALWDKSKRSEEEYEFPTQLKATAFSPLSGNFSIMNSLRAELSDKNGARADLRTGIDYNFAPNDFGLRVFIGLNSGRKYNSLETGLDGIEGNGFVYGVQVYHGAVDVDRIVQKIFD